MTVCLSPGGLNTYTTESAADALLVATVHGAYLLERQAPGQPWRTAAHTLVGLHVSSLLWEPEQDVVFAGIHGGGLYASLDGGRSWKRRTDGLTFEHVYSLASASRDGKVVLFAGTEPAHLFQSFDHGANWDELLALRSVPSVSAWRFLSPPFAAHVKNVACDPRDTNIMFVSIEQGGLLKSMDGGCSFQELNGFYEDVHRVVMCPSNLDVMYMSGGEGIYRTDDAGQTWEHLTDRSMRIGYPDPLFIAPGNEQLLFTAGGLSRPRNWRETRRADGRVARSRDGGRTWETLEGLGWPPEMTASIEGMSLNAHGREFTLFIGTTDGQVFASDDEGDSWIMVAGGLPPVSKGAHYHLVVSRATLPPDPDVVPLAR